MGGELTEGGEGSHLHHRGNSSGGGHGGGLHVHHSLHLLRHCERLLRGDDGSSPASSLALVRGAPNEQDRCGRCVVPQLRNPVVDCREEGGRVRDAVTEQEHVRLSVCKGLLVLMS